ncbi:MAG TPA: lipid A-modifier LpxR family protein [Puia sp.]|nr:lipid A-modifier LpxR family protein [Puia sp.]
MNRILLLLFIIAGLSITGGPTLAQSRPAPEKDSVTRMLRFYEDDDYINFWGCGTDNAYTNGSRIDYFYQPAHPPHGILGKFAPRAGAGSTDVYGWGLFEIMYTPDNLTKKEWQPNDYQYAGALVAIHTRYSYNPEKKYSLQTELVMGVIGPSALAGEIQTDFHRLIHYTKPMGWGHQFRNDVLLNLNVTAEKQLLAAGKWLTIIGGARVYGGTMENGAALYPMLLIGKMDPYFNGFFSRYTSPGHDRRGRKNWQGYFLFKPELQYYAQNALLQGGLFTHNPNLQPDAGTGKDLPTSSSGALRQAAPPAPKAPDLQPWLPAFTYGFVFTRGRVGFSMTENVSASALRNLYCHNVGNASLYIGW